MLTHIFALDFSGAYDIIRYATLMEKMAQLPIPDEVYNWKKDFSMDIRTVLSSLEAYSSWPTFWLASAIGPAGIERMKRINGITAYWSAGNITLICSESAT